MELKSIYGVDDKKDFKEFINTLLDQLNAYQLEELVEHIEKRYYGGHMLHVIKAHEDTLRKEFNNLKLK